MRKWLIASAICSVILLILGPAMTIIIALKVSMPTMRLNEPLFWIYAGIMSICTATIVAANLITLRDKF